MRYIGAVGAGLRDLGGVRDESLLAWRLTSPINHYAAAIPQNCSGVNDTRSLQVKHRGKVSVVLCMPNDLHLPVLSSHPSFHP